MQTNYPALNENVNLADQQDSLPLLSKLIRASALTAFKRDQTQLSIEKFKNFLHTKISYHPFESEFKSPSWDDDIVKILLDDQLNDHSHFDSTTRWFSIDSATVTLLITSSKLREPAEVYSDDLTMLRNISTMQLSAALRKNIRNLQQSIALANQVLHNYKEKKQANREKELQKQLQNQECEEQVEEKSVATLIDHDDNNVIETEPTMNDNNSNPVICGSIDSDVDDSMLLLRKLIYACAISAFPDIKKTELPLKTFQHYLLSNVLYHPFESEFKSLSWDDIVKILIDGKLHDHENNQSKASPLFSINSSTVRLLIKLNIVKLKEPAQVYSDDLTMLRNTSTIQLSAALRKNFSKIPKTLSMANQAFHKKKNKVEKRGEWKKNKLYSKNQMNQNANINFPNIDD